MWLNMHVHISMYVCIYDSSYIYIHIHDMHLILMNVAKMCDSFQEVRRGLRCMLAEEMKAVGHFKF